MMRTTAVYVLDPVVDDPRFEGFATAKSASVLGRKSIKDDLVPGFGVANKDPNWEQLKFGKLWPTPPVIGRVSEFNDYPCINLLFPAFSERAVNTLREFLEPNGEILPLAANTETSFFFYNILKVTDALDQERSICHFTCDPPTTALGINYFVFSPAKVQGLSIFRIREKPGRVCVTNHFVDRVESHGLTGFNFKKVWPLPEGVNWRMQDGETKDSRKALKQHTLILRLPQSGRTDELTQFQSLEDALDDSLQVASLDSKYFGSYEGHEVIDGEYRVFLSCPDVEQLWTHLKKDLEKLQWQKEIDVIRRFGGLYDSNAKEEMTKI